MRLRGTFGSTRRCLFGLGLYLVLTAVFLLFISKSSFERNINGLSLNDNGQGHGHIWSNYFVERSEVGPQPFSIWNTTAIFSSKVCLNEQLRDLDERLIGILHTKRMLPYFKFGDKFALSVPKWQEALKTPQHRSTDIKGGSKYFISAVIRVRLYDSDRAKWTVRELKQWLHYQFWAGTEHVYICMHYLQDDERFDKYLSEYVYRGLVTVYRWANITAIPGSETYERDNTHNQVSCYNYIFRVHGKDSVWHYNFDLDENPYVPTDHCEGFLARYLRKVNPGTSELRLSNYVMMGQGDRSRDIFYDRINRITPKPLNGNVKPIYRISMTTNVGMHGCVTRWKLEYSPGYEIRLLHYWGARQQNWGNDTQDMLKKTEEFNDVRDSIAVNVRHSLIAFGEFDAFSANTGP